MKIFDYLDDIKKFIKENFNNDLIFGNNNNKIEVEDAYTTDKPKAPCIYVMLQDGSENTSGMPFEKENNPYVPLQFYVYGKKMKHNNELESAYKMTILIAEKLTEILDRNNLYANNNNIISIRRTSMTTPLPINDDFELYYIAIRYDITIQLDYKKIY